MIGTSVMKKLIKLATRSKRIKILILTKIIKSHSSKKKRKKDDENNNISNTSFISINSDHIESSSSVIEYSRKLQKSGRIG